MYRILILFLLISAVSCKSTSNQKDAADASATEETSRQESDVRPIINVVMTVDAFDEQLAKFRQDGTPVQLIDVRTQGELDETGYLKGADHMDWNNGTFKAEFEKLNKDVPVMVYCRSAARSGDARRFLIKKGFKEVYDMEGGINSWLEAGKPVKGGE